MIQPFHVAIPVHDLNASRDFYVSLLGCKEGRSSEEWIDFDLFGHQFVVHLDANLDIAKSITNQVDGHGVPVPHYGVVLKWKDWERLSENLIKAGVKFLIEPYIRFKGQVGEQATMFFCDPSGNALEFKAFKDLSQLFAK